jgi:hypothetical protein
MGKLDLRRLRDEASIYTPPRCTELSDAAFTILYDGGARETLTVAEYDCAKLGGALYLVSGQGSAYALDTAGGCVTRVRAGGGTPEISFGTFGAGGARHAATQDLSGNTVTWVLGTEPGRTVTAVYTDGGVSLSAPELAASDFSAVRCGEGVYLQSALVRAGGSAAAVVLLSDFTRGLCAGAALGEEYRRFGGYGRLAGK